MLYRVGTVVVYGTAEDPRISWAVYKVSDAVRIGRVREAGGVRSTIQVPISDPKSWLRYFVTDWVTTPE